MEQDLQTCEAGRARFARREKRLFSLRSVTRSINMEPSYAVIETDAGLRVVQSSRRGGPRLPPKNTAA